MSTVYNAGSVPIDLTGGRVIPAGEEAKNVRADEITDREKALADEGLIVITEARKRGSEKEKSE